MKILLLVSPNDPNNNLNVKSLPPLSMAIIVSYLRKNNINVRAYDLNENIIKNYSKISKEEWLKVYTKEFVWDSLVNTEKIGVISDLYQQILEGINIGEYDLVGISTGLSCSFFEIHSSFLFGKLIQTKYDKPVIFGGLNIGLLFFSNLFNEIFETFFDNFKYVIVGPGEKSLLKLIQSYENGCINDIYPTLKGCVLYSDGKIITKETDTPSLNCPDYTDFNLNFYKTYFAGTNDDENVRQFYKATFPFNIEISNFIKKNFPDSNYAVNVIPYYFNQNCPYNCAFCSQSFSTSRPITKDVNEIIQDIDFLQKQYNSKYFYFLNNTINFTPTFVRKFCSMIIDKGIQIYWSDCARINGLTKELLELMYKAGCRKLVFGFETGSEKVLKYINKKIDKNRVLEVLQWCTEIGIYGELEVIVGLPYEFDEDFEKTYTFVKKNTKYINAIYLNRYFVAPASLISIYPEKYDLELIRGETYESMLEWRRKLVTNNFNLDLNDLGKNEYQGLKFNEINGRPNEVIEKETHVKYLKMLNLMLGLPGFTIKNQILNSIRSKATI